MDQRLALGAWTSPPPIPPPPPGGLWPKVSGGKGVVVGIQTPAVCPLWVLVKSTEKETLMQWIFPQFQHPKDLAPAPWRCVKDSLPPDGMQVMLMGVVVGCISFL